MATQVKFQNLFSHPKYYHQIIPYYYYSTNKIQNITSWSLAIKTASSPQQALTLYKQMLNQSIPFENYSIVFALKSLTHSFSSQNLPLIRHLHTHLLKIGFSSDVHVATSLLRSYGVCAFYDARKLFDEMPERNVIAFNTMINAYAKSLDLKKARLIFDEMPVKDIASYSAMISGYLNNGNWNEGVKLFQEMIVKDSLKPDYIILISILSGCTRISSLGLLLGKSIHCFIEKNGWELNVELGTVLVDVYAKCGFLRGAFRVFEKINERNVVTWSVMICGFGNHGYSDEAFLVFKQMKKAGIKPNEITFTGILCACNHAGLIEKGKKYFKEMIEEYKIEPGIRHYGCMVDLLGKGGRLEEAYELIKSMKLEPDIVIWGSLLAACKVHNQFETAERVIERVLEVAKPESDGGVYALISDIYYEWEMGRSREGKGTDGKES